MRCLLFVAALAAVCFASRDEMLSTNRIVASETALAANADTCNECKSIVKRFVEAVDDPTKLAELKMLLSALCHETSYAEECKLFVAKLDVIIKKLEPYLRDSEAVCKKIHLCANPRLTAFHKIGLLYAKQAMNDVDRVETVQRDFVCDECQLAALELKKVIDDPQQRKDVKSFLHENVCLRIPKYSGACDMMLEEFLPELFNELDALLANAKQACASLGFCPRTRNTFSNKMVSPKRTLFGFWKRSSYISTQPSILVSCFECKVFFDEFLQNMDNNQVEIAGKLRDWACPKLPENLYDGCIDFLNMYAPTVVHMTVLQFSSDGICDKFGMCDASSAVGMRSLSADSQKTMQCDACKAMTKFLKYELAQPDLKADLVAGFTSHACPALHYDGLTALCDNLAQSYLPKFVDHLVAKLEAGEKACHEIIHAC